MRTEVPDFSETSRAQTGRWTGEFHERICFYCSEKWENILMLKINPGYFSLKWRLLIAAFTFILDSLLLNISASVRLYLPQDQNILTDFSFSVPNNIHRGFCHTTLLWCYLCIVFTELCCSDSMQFLSLACCHSLMLLLPRTRHMFSYI